MLKHPWLDLPDNYDFKYSEREYDVMMLKKDLKNQMKGTGEKQDEVAQEDRQEMNELIDSDPELYAADDDEGYNPSKKRTQKDKLKSEIQNYLNNNDINDKLGNGVLSSNAETDNKIFSDLFNEEEISLEDPEEGRERHKERKDNDVKIHNSFTGPYPLDPTEFSHTDKGENY